MKQEYRKAETGGIPEEEEIKTTVEVARAMKDRSDIRYSDPQAETLYVSISLFFNS